MLRLSKFEYFKKTREEFGMKALLYCSELMTYEFYQSNLYIFKQGDFGDKFYIIFGGNVQVLVKEKNEKVEK